MKSRGTYIGSFSLKRQLQPKEAWVHPVTGQVVRKGWEDPNVPEYQRNWVVVFSMPGQAQRSVTAGTKLVRYRICDRCMAEVENPVVTRPRCECQQRVTGWAESWLETQTVLLQRGEIARLEEMRAPKTWSSPQEVLALYVKRGPADARARVNSLGVILGQARGLSLDSFGWSDLTKRLKKDWAEMRQEAGRRGWLGLGAGKKAPAGAWEELRALKAAGELPALDLRTVAEWNTTITSYFTNVNTIFGEDARDRILEGLRVPDLGDFLGAKFKLPKPKGHKSIPPEVMAEIERRLPALRVEDEQLYAFFRVCEETGVRPGTLRALGGEALRLLDAVGLASARAQMAAEWRVPVEELGEFGALLCIPAVKGGHEVVTPVSTETVRLLVEMRRDASLFGCVHPTEMKDLHNRRLNEWLRECGVQGTQVAYLLRHRKAQALRRFGGVAAVSVGLGHVDEAMAKRYSREDRLVPAVRR